MYRRFHSCYHSNKIRSKQLPAFCFLSEHEPYFSTSIKLTRKDKQNWRGINSSSFAKKTFNQQNFLKELIRVKAFNINVYVYILITFNLQLENNQKFHKFRRRFAFLLVIHVLTPISRDATFSITWLFSCQTGVTGNTYVLLFEGVRIAASSRFSSVLAMTCTNYN
jgi:hypothetical protein